MRKALAALVVLAVLGGGFGVVGVFIVPRALAAFYPTPENPLTFNHAIHVQTLQMECEFCHREVAEGRAATVPSLEQCMFCHKAVGLDRENIKVVRAAWESGEPLNWVRQHRIPDHTQFNHEPHITAGFDCAECHGDVAAVTGQIEQVRTLKMGDCVDCHRQNNAPTQCATCHY